MMKQRVKSPFQTLRVCVCERLETTHSFNAPGEILTTMTDLPPNATAISRKYAQRMTELVRDCPKELGREIYLYCSVAKGYADQYSDIEVTFLVDEVREPAVYEAWLRSVGAKVDPATMAWGGGHTTKSWLDGIFVEAAWRPMTSLNELIEKVSNVRTTNHWDLVGAWHILHALPLTDAPQLEAWQNTLKTYPPELQSKLIRDGVRFLCEPHQYPLSIINSYKLAARQAPMALSGELTWTVERTLRILFALNRRWESDYKWLSYEASRLERKPERLVERVNDVFMLPDLRERVKTCFQLLIDVLKLVPDDIDISREIQHVSEALEPEKVFR